VTYEPSHVCVAVTNTAPAQAPSSVQAPSLVQAQHSVPVGAAMSRGTSVGPATVPAPAVSDLAAAPAAWLRPAGPSYGLAGIAERVASCGGALSLGPADTGGFTVSARLPLT
jgi:hypothetical protein